MFGFGKKEHTIEKESITLQEVVDRFNIEDLNDTHMVVSDKVPVELAETGPPMGQIGVTGQTQYRRLGNDEYNPALYGRRGLMKFNEMRKSDGQVKSSLRLAKTPILAGRWYMEPASTRQKDRMISAYVWNCLTKWSSMSWPQLLIESLSMCDFGFYAFEKVWGYNLEPQFAGKMIWEKFSPRHPLDIQNFYYDENGGPAGINYIGTPISPGELCEIPIKKLLVFTFDKEAGNMEGVSMLRSAYKHYYYKENLYKVDAIQKERHGIGIPIIKLPPGFTPEDRALADEIGRNLRTNEKSHITLPPMWDILFADLKGNPVDCIPSIEHHDSMIRRNILADMVVPRAQDEQDMFIRSTRFIADIVRDVFNKYAIPELVKVNWSNVTDFPELRVRRIGETQDYRTWSFAIRNLAGAGFLTPDDVLEEYIRDELDLPKPDPATARVVSTPQNANNPTDPNEEDPSTDPNGDGEDPKNDPKKPTAPRVGMPRQSTAPGMKQQAQGTGKTNTGADSSGG